MSEGLDKDHPLYDEDVSPAAMACMAIWVGHRTVELFDQYGGRPPGTAIVKVVLESLRHQDYFIQEKVKP